MLTRLTLASNSCNRGNPAGDHSMSGKGPDKSYLGSKPRYNHHGLTGQSKVRRVKAKLPEPQTWVLSLEATHGWFTCRLT